MPTSECEHRPTAGTGTEHKLQYAKEMKEQDLRRRSVLVEALWKISCRKSCTVLHSRGHAVGVHTMHNHCSVLPLPHRVRSVEKKKEEKEKKFVLFVNEGERIPEDLTAGFHCWILRAIDMPSRRDVGGACYRAGRLTFILV